MGITLTDRKLKSLKPARLGQRYDVMDSDVRGFGVRVSDKGQRSFILIGRYPGSHNRKGRAPRREAAPEGRLKPSEAALSG
jgi:hypothetical protein